jgi:hypothetical protein
MTLQDQFTLIKEGKGNKEIFLKQAKSLFPQYVTNASTFQETTFILKQKGIISEAAGGIVTTGTTPDWVSIFKENMGSIQEEKEKIVNAKQNGDKSYTVEYSDGTTKKIYVSNDAWDEINDKYGKLNETKAVEKKTTKEVTDAETRNYDYKDEKNINNVSFNQYLLGLSVEIDNIKNVDKTIEELKAIVTKNLTKDNQYYLKSGQFGIEGLGYKDDLPGHSKPREVKGKYKASGMEPVKLKESMSGRSPQIGDNVYEYQFNTWKEKLYSIIMNDAGLDKDEISMDELELQKYFNANMSPEQVYNNVWLKDAGNFRNTGLFEESDEEDEGVYESKLRQILSKLIKEAIDLKNIEDTGKVAADHAKSKLIDREIIKRKKKLKALTTLKELEEDSVNPKKIKELNDDIKKLEKLKSKLGESKKSSEPKDTQVLDEESLEEATVAANPATSTKLSAAYKKKQAALVKLAAAETEVGKADSEIQNIEKT